MGIVLSLHEVNNLYEYYYSKKPPLDLSFTERLKSLVVDIGYKDLESKRKELSDGQEYFHKVIPITTPQGVSSKDSKGS